jgi:DNA-nicking Smr family endonuclease
MKSKKSASSKARAGGANGNPTKAAVRMIDLHGRTQDEIFDLVDRFLLNEIKKNSQQIKIMTGKGKGIVQKQVIDYLKKAGYHWNYERLDNGKANEGVLIVYLD